MLKIINTVAGGGMRILKKNRIKDEYKYVNQAILLREKGKSAQIS